MKPVSINNLIQKKIHGLMLSESHIELYYVYKQGRTATMSNPPTGKSWASKGAKGH